jgi:hypothetical protein
MGGEPELEGAGRREARVKAEAARERIEAQASDRRLLAQGRAEYRDRLRRFREDAFRLQGIRGQITRLEKTLAEARTN